MTVWRKSSYSPDGDNCVAVGRGVGIRDTKAPAVHLPLTRGAWTAFLAAIKHGARTAPWRQLLDHPADAGMADELRELLPDTTDDLEDPWSRTSP